MEFIKRRLGVLAGLMLLLSVLAPAEVSAAMVNNGVMAGTGTWGLDIENGTKGVIISGNYTETVYNHGLIVGGSFNNIVDEGDGRYGLRMELANLNAEAVTSEETYTYGDVEYWVMSYGEEYSFKLTGAEGYDLPGSVEIMRGESPLVSGTDYTYDRATGIVEISAEAVDYPLTVEASGIDADAVARIGQTYYLTLNDAFDAASEMEGFNGAPVNADNPVVIEVLKDHTLAEEILVRDDWDVRLTSAEGGPYTVTRNPDTASGTMIEMFTAVSYPPRDYNSTLILDNIILDGGAAEDSKETGGILTIYGTAVMNDGAVIQNNKGKNNGSAVDIQEGTFVMNDGAVIRSNTTAGSGGAVMVWAEFIMNGGTISDNEALGNYTYGGGVDVQFTDGASFTMNGGTITGNSAYNGGGVYFSNNGSEYNTFLYGGTVTDNVSRGVFGDSPEDVYTQNGAALVMGDDIQIGNLKFASSKSKIIVASPLVNTAELAYDLMPANGDVIIEKGDSYGDGSLDRSKFVFNGSGSRCLWLSEDGSQIIVNAHSGGVDTCTDGAVCANCGAVYGEPTGHKWGEPEWTWAEDHRSASVKFICQNDNSHIETVEAEISISTTEEDCTHDGESVYTAEAVFNEETYTDVWKKTIPMNGHSPGDEWKSDGTAHWKECEECGERLEEASHTFEWVTDKEATETEVGSRHEECSVCGYKKAAVEIPATGSSDAGDAGQDPGAQGNRGPQAEESVSPKSGDSGNYVSWLILMLLACGGTAGAVICKRRSK